MGAVEEEMSGVAITDCEVLPLGFWDFRAALTSFDAVVIFSKDKSDSIDGAYWRL